MQKSVLLTSAVLLPGSPSLPRRLLIAKYGTPATAAAVLGIGGTVVNMH